MTDTQTQQEIRAALEVIDPDTFDAGAEAERRIDFLASYLRTSGLKGYVLGISGGVDSTTGGRLAQLACERVRAEGGEATFIAVRLPYHVQKDEADAQRALDFIAADEEMTVDIGPGVDAQWDAVLAAGLTVDDVKDDYHKGNVKARHRMVAQFTIAGVRGMAVIGTDQAAEAVVGFYTKFGDGAADLTPLFGLPKRRVKAIARHLGAPEQLVEKVPTADLESDKPLIADEVALGVSYQAVDDYLEGQDISAEDEATILGWYRRTAHKRALPVTPDGFLGDR
ncbi:ammonia-dependent NAD(+) synthetase [Ornithinimicrobium tianjinense]|uniref:NH(3)-dependent NAD(+) synthetase n=1 Tax=Ornithinimicrobium tianjinense TaxID=1195761 RepID=A0A917F3E0_9MICO|nr:ammonia-dependent NAD(+) synthetase [Ornithinimicrobium tianjinense]GGF46309.1 NH(3)-dependent NAD(+) synthetase [Ornithinimicrobium tianjinense]